MKENCEYIVERFDSNSDINYLSEFLSICKESLMYNDFSVLRWNGVRKDMVNEYSWGIPTLEVIDEFRSKDRIVELCAGSGYWSYLTDEYSNCDVRAFDKEYIDGYYEVEDYYCNDIDVNNMLICWPPSGKNVTKTLIEDQDPSTFYFVGVPYSNITETCDLYDFLISYGYDQTDFIELPSWPGVNDNCYVFEK